MRRALRQRALQGFGTAEKICDETKSMRNGAGSGAERLLENTGWEGQRSGREWGLAELVELLLQRGVLLFILRGADLLLDLPARACIATSVCRSCGHAGEASAGESDLCQKVTKSGVPDFS